jgi:hypothetical protein
MYANKSQLSRGSYSTVPVIAVVVVTVVVAVVVAVAVAVVVVVVVAVLLPFWLSSPKGICCCRCLFLPSDTAQNTRHLDRSRAVSSHDAVERPPYLPFTRPARSQAP